MFLYSQAKSDFLVVPLLPLHLKKILQAEITSGNEIENKDSNVQRSERRRQTKNH